MCTYGTVDILDPRQELKGKKQKVHLCSERRHRQMCDSKKRVRLRWRRQYYTKTTQKYLYFIFFPNVYSYIVTLFTSF